MRLKFIPAPPDDLIGAKVVNVDTGEEIDNIASITYTHHAGQLPRVVIELFGMDVEVEGEMVGEQAEEE